MKTSGCARRLGPAPLEPGPSNPTFLNPPATAPSPRQPRRPLRLLAGLMLLPVGPALLHAQGSPPLITDDPGTPGPGRWEINLGISTERRPDLRISELPLLELNYGMGETVQLKFGVPRLVQSEPGRTKAAGTGNSVIGVKWRFHDPSDDGLALSVHPQVEFNNPGSSSPDRGLVERGRVFLLPIQLERGFGPLVLNLEIGREFRPAGDAWYYGAALRHRLHEKCEIAVEFVGTAASGFGRSQLTTNCSFVIDVSELSSLLVSVGRELHNHDESRATLIGYLGWQLRR